MPKEEMLYIASSLLFRVLSKSRATAMLSWHVSQVPWNCRLSAEGSDELLPEVGADEQVDEDVGRGVDHLEQGYFYLHLP